MNKLSHYFLFCLAAGSLFAACQKNKLDDSTPQPDITSLDTGKLNIPVSSGHIGLVLDTRDIMKKGYKPTRLSLSIDGALSSFSNDNMEVDTLTGLAILRIPRESVSDADAEQVAKGAPVSLRVYDKEDALLAELQEGALPVSASNNPIAIQTTKPKVVPPLKIIAGAKYSIQTMPIDGYPDGSIWGYTYEKINESVARFGGSITNLVESPFVSPGAKYIKPEDEADANVGQLFTFESVNNNDSIFYIKARGNKEKYLFTDARGMTVIYTGYPANLPDEDYRFILSQDEEGGITIKSYKYGAAIKAGSVKMPDNTTKTILAVTGTTPVSFRLFPMDIEWNAQDMGIAYDQPIMQPAKLDFALATTINNCGAAEVKQIIGKTDTKTTTITAGTQENFSITTQNEARVDVSLTMGVNADLFGVAGMSRELSLSAGYTYTNTQMRGNMSHYSDTETETTAVSVQREVTVPPYTSLDAYDAVQSYENVVVHYVQRVRVRGQRGGKYLTGEEIISQLMSNLFGGVVTDIGNDYVTITIRGKADIKNLMATQTDVLTRPCNR